jgi:hypothetical protein
MGTFGFEIGAGSEGKLDRCGGRSRWRGGRRGDGGEAAVAEMVATMYDASLDAFARNRRGMW